MKISHVQLDAWEEEWCIAPLGISCLMIQKTRTEIKIAIIFASLNAHPLNLIRLLQELLWRDMATVLPHSVDQKGKKMSSALKLYFHP